MTAGWLLDELASAGRENLDAEHVRNYDAKEDAGAVEEVRLLQRLGFGSGSEVIDLGAGTGQFTAAAAPEFGRVVAVEVSPVMLDRLRAKVAALPNVAVVQAGFLSYRYDGAGADVVYSRYALHHLPDFWKAVALTRARRMLRAGGILRLADLVYHFEPADAEERIEAWCGSVTGEGPQEWNRADVEEHVRDEHSTFSWLLEPMIERAGFIIEDADHSPDGVVARYIARATG